MGAAVIGALIAGLLILSQSGWMLVLAVRTSGPLSTGVTPTFATLVRALPSGSGTACCRSRRAVRLAHPRWFAGRPGTPPRPRNP